MFHEFKFIQYFMIFLDTSCFSYFLVFCFLTFLWPKSDLDLQLPGTAAWRRVASAATRPMPNPGGASAWNAPSCCSLAWLTGQAWCRPTMGIIIQWIGLRENLQETMVFTIKYIGVSCKFSHHPILWIMDQTNIPSPVNQALNGYNG